MADAIDAARYLVGVGYDPLDPDESLLLCPKRLQKMLYYAQGWSLAVRGRPLFRQPIEAWEHGPVVRDVYEAYAGRSGGILPIGNPPADRPLAPDDRRLLDMVWREYARFTPFQLRQMTRSERPWVEARGGLSAEARSDAVVSLETMTAFFTEQAVKTAAVGSRPSPREVWEADAAVDAGRTTAAADLFGDLLGPGSKAAG